MNGVLDLLVGRSYSAEEEDPALVRAMPVVLRIERATPPGRTAILEAAAAAAIAVCLDPRAEAEGEWHDEVVTWIHGRIRKISRRARGGHWEAVQALPGVTISVDGAEARALVPGLVVEAPKELSRLQISGSELPEDEPGPVPAGVPVLWLNPKVPMTAGKAAAQVGHGTMLLAPTLSAGQLETWAANDFRTAVRTPSARRWDSLLAAGAVSVRDAGFTEVAPGTTTVIAEWTGV
ncbi:peptidyl-tRNA hydrolase [Umezawaea sp. Da 62-37]|uniref:peptidyl-tRNA hydrolase n=1 Tax=Umezawaea sp. Da 62-37 TaxID=3075927 RepID=UPI0028F6F24F|nr:peptidyl-tRNA hydrolase [Umezawaea sp. Da 62-37]WNV82722.1 peptidyl-tRNA hydrolase [Umezawaea sp. Da 62-37]